jgi:arylsulfatase A
MNRRDFLATSATGLAAAAWLRLGSRSTAATPGRPPNIVFVLGDDVGIADTGVYGGGFTTPTIDALAAGGTRFSHCYSTPLCGPSRCQLLTGRYPFRTGLISNNSHNAVAPDRETMIPTVMKAAGYATASVGKWGQICLGPREWGFDEHLVFQGSGHYWPRQDPRYNVNGEARRLRVRQYLPDVMHQFAVDFVTRQKDRPFLLYYPMSHIHAPILETPDSKPGANPKQLYADNVQYMDKLIGKLLDELERLKLRDNTLVIFAGDNGTARFGPGLIDGQPIHGRKGSMLEGGARVPLIANWPGVTPAGRILDDLTDFSDFLVTLAEVGEAKLPTDRPLDGQSFAPALLGPNAKPRPWCYVELTGRSYVTDRQYKLTGDGNLFDMAKAPFAEIPVAADSKDEAAVAARARLQAVLADHQARPWNGGGGAAARRNQNI